MMKDENENYLVPERHPIAAAPDVAQAYVHHEVALETSAQTRTLHRPWSTLLLHLRQVVEPLRRVLSVELSHLQWMFL